jgi:hypothetical protein
MKETKETLTIHRTRLDDLPMITQIHLSLQKLWPPDGRNPYLPKLRRKVEPRDETVDEGLVGRGDVINAGQPFGLGARWSAKSDAIMPSERRRP